MSTPRALTEPQAATMAGLGLPADTVELDGWEQGTSDPAAPATCARVHVTSAAGERWGYVIDPAGELIAASPLNADGEPVD